MQFLAGPHLRPCEGQNKVSGATRGGCVSRRKASPGGGAVLGAEWQRAAISGVVRAALAERGVTVVKSVNSGDEPRIHYISAVGPQRSHSASLSRSQFIDL